jgi:hypothetical protein
MRWWEECRRLALAGRSLDDTKLLRGRSHQIQIRFCRFYGRSEFSRSLRLLPCLWRRRRHCRRQSRPRLLGLRHSFRRSIRGPAILKLGRGRHRFLLFRLSLNERPFSLAHKRELIVLAIPINAHQVAQMHLFGSQQVRQRINDVPLDRALQVPRPIALVSPFLQQEIPARTSHAKQELPLGRLQNAAPDQARCSKPLPTAHAAVDETPPACPAGS